MFLPENSIELCNRLHLKEQQKYGGNKGLDLVEENVAFIDNVLEYKKLLKQLNPNFHWSFLTQFE